MRLMRPRLLLLLLLPRKSQNPDACCGAATTILLARLHQALQASVRSLMMGTMHQHLCSIVLMATLPSSKLGAGSIPSTSQKFDQSFDARSILNNILEKVATGSGVYEYCN